MEAQTLISQIDNDLDSVNIKMLEFLENQYLAEKKVFHRSMYRHAMILASLASFACAMIFIFHGQITRELILALSVCAVLQLGGIFAMFRPKKPDMEYVKLNRVLNEIGRVSRESHMR